MSSSRPGIAGSRVATGRGDDGSTGLLFGGRRIPKDDPRTEAYGTVDEAVAALGRARAELGRMAQDGRVGPSLAGLPELILRLQRDLFVVGAELAVNPEARARLVDGESRVTREMVDRVEGVLREMERHIVMPKEFVVPGETLTSAALEQARTVVRRAERRVVTLQRGGLGPGDHLLPYLNRLADLLWVLARAAEQGEAHVATPSRVGTRSRPIRQGRVAPDVGAIRRSAQGA